MTPDYLDVGCRPAQNPAIPIAVAVATNFERVLGDQPPFRALFITRQRDHVDTVRNCGEAARFCTFLWYSLSRVLASR